MNRLRLIHIASGALAVISAGVGVVAARLLPPGYQVPTHYDFTGTPNDWAGPHQAFLMMPVVIVAVWALFGFISGRARRNGVELQTRGFAASWLATLSMFAAFQMLLIWRAFDNDAPAIGQGVAFVFGAFLIAIGMFAPDLPRNRSVGIRTRSSVGNNEAWRRTHNHSQKILVSGGIVLCVLSTVGSFDAVWVLLAVVVAMVIAGQVARHLAAQRL